MPSLVNTSSRHLNPFDPVYLHNLQCTWLIKAPQHKIIKFWWTEFDLTQPGDYVVIRDGTSAAAVLINNFTTKPDLKDRWTSSGRYLWIRFKSDNYNVAKGFNLTWSFTTKPEGTIP